MRGDCVSFDGRRNPVIKTPNIDNLAKDGAAFTIPFVDLRGVVLLRVNMCTQMVTEAFTNYYNRTRKIYSNS
jgi:hypothetical protein